MGKNVLVFIHNSLIQTAKINSNRCARKSRITIRISIISKNSYDFLVDTNVIKQQIKKGHLYSAMFLLFFVLRDFFEITLVNNQMAIAFLFWAWIANGGLDKIFKYRNKDAINNIKDRLIAINTNS